MTIHQRRDDSPNPWRIQVREHPARRESISWREAIRDAVKDSYPQAPFTSPPEGTRFTVEVIFRMTPEDLARPAFDLDNFAKPVLDTLFTSQNVSRLTGVLLPEVNDTWVFRLLLEKVRVETPQEQGADITISWHPSATHCLGFSSRVKAAAQRLPVASQKSNPLQHEPAAFPRYPDCRIA